MTTEQSLPPPAPLPPVAPQGIPARPTSALAIVSLISGILGWTLMPFLGSLAAVICGHMARAEIRREPSIDGDGMAVAGLVLGWTAIGLSVLLLVMIVLVIVFFGGLAAFLAAANGG